MKILYLIARSDEIGGAHVHVRDLALYASQQGHHVAIAVGGNGVYVQELLKLNLNTYSIGCLSRSLSVFNDLRALRRIANIISHFNPDIVSAHSAKAGILARCLYGFVDAKILFTAHGWSFASGVSPIPRFFYLALEKLFALRASKIVCVCRADLDLALHFKLASRQQFLVIYNGMPDVPAPFQSSNGSKYFSEPSPVNILCIARFESQKDHKSLILALSKLLHISWTLTLVGDGHEKSAILSLVSRLGLNARVSFLGRVSSASVPALCSSSDMFVLPSLWEGFPRSIIEALRSSLPVIASDVGGVSESVLNGVNGFVVPPSDVEALRVALEKLLTSISLRQSFGQQSRHLYENHFQFDVMASKTIALYNQILDQ